MIKPKTQFNWDLLKGATKAPKIRRKKLGKKFTADEWLTANFEKVIDKYGTGGRYIVVVDNVGLVFTDKDGDPRTLAIEAKKLFPKSSPLFFRVPRPEEFICALITR